MSHTSATAPVRLLAGEGAEHEASERAEAVEQMLAEHHDGRSLSTDERFAALAPQLMALLADRPVDEVRAVLGIAWASLLLGKSARRIVGDLVAEVRHG